MHTRTDQRAYDIVEPYPPAMVESLRAVGYDLPMAVADLVDNSITAGARSLNVIFHWDGDASMIAIVDDGAGMTEERLIDAMRVGSSDPTEVRDKHDLGRFGLGLKTASFSQCRRVTVHTKSSRKKIATRCWDLDYVKQTKQWRILRTGTTQSDHFKLEIGTSGTVVIWEKLDRVVRDAQVDNPRHHDLFNERAALVEQHLGMVFHRFMSGIRSIKFCINGRPIKPWDPFLQNHEATQHPDSQSLSIGPDRVQVDCFILPHHSKLTPKEHADVAGPNGWLAHQGFYVYRNRRLLVPGDWLGLGVRKEEHYKLARIRVDLSNTMDDLWEIDVKKNTARVPVSIRKDLANLGRVTRERAVAVYRHRGKVISKGHGPKDSFVWEQRVRHGKISYHLNREHPLVNRVLERSGAERSATIALLRLIEESIPVPLIVLTSAEKPDQGSTPFEYTPSSEIYSVMTELFLALVASGLNKEEALRKLRSMEPFDRFPEYVQNLPATLEAKGAQ